MPEFITTAIVLDREPTREYDEYIHLYSRENGRIVARATSSRKIHSKFSHHLNVLNLVRTRLVGAGSFVVADAVALERFQALRGNRREFSRALQLASFIRGFFPEGGADERAWDFFNENLRKANVDTRGFLSALGFGAGTSCHDCGKRAPERFLISGHSFLCSACSSKIPDNQLLYI